jgi:predicted aspartyl protease
MTLDLAILILIVWAVAVIYGSIGRVVDYEKMVNFSDICAWAVAGISACCALYVLVHHVKEAKEQLCVVYNGTEYCSTQHSETETIIIDVDGNGNITVKLK